MGIEGALELARHVVLFAVLIAAVYTDLSRGKIYNWSTLGGIVVGLLVNLALGGLWDGGAWHSNLGGSALAMALVLLLFGWPYLKGGIAAGDVKLLLAVAAIGGLKGRFIFYALFYCALLGFLMTLLVLIWRGRLLAGIKGAIRFTFTLQRLEVAKTGQEDGAEKRAATGITIPYGFAVAIGSVIAYYLVEVAG